MAIQDSDPERRNLIVTSMAFIVYYYAGGSFPESSVRLQIINADFSKPEILSYIAWCSFIWFIYRYWLTHKSSFALAFNSDFNEWCSAKYIVNYVNKHFDQEMHLNGSIQQYYPAAIKWSIGHVVLTCQEATINRNADGKMISRSSATTNRKPNKDIKLSKFKGWYLAIRATLSCVLTRPSFSNYVVPYILAIIAIFGATCH